MIKPLELFIGLRYTRSKRRERFVSIITFISIMGIAIGVWALITIMSVMNGFHQELRGRILYVVSHVTISETNGELRDWPGLVKKVQQHPDVVDSAPFVLGQGMISHNSNVQGALIRGVDVQTEQRVTPVLNHVIAGSSELNPGDFGIILGSQLARTLGVDVGDKVTLIAPKGNVSPTGLLPRLKRFTVTGLFEIDMYEYDSGIALINIQDAQRFFDMTGRVSGLRLKLSDADLARQVKYDMARDLPPNFWIRDWTGQHANFFNALEIEKRVVRIVLFLIVLVAAINIISTLVMVVSDKQSDVAILRTLGMSPASVMQIFMVQGLLIGIIGTCIGAITGIITALNIETWIPALERLLHVEFFPSNVYIISHFPADLQWPDVIGIVSISLLISFLATIYPALNASKVQPAEALRYE